MKKTLAVAALVASSLSLVACTPENECPLQEVVVNRGTADQRTILVCVVEPPVVDPGPTRPSPTRPPTSPPPTTNPPTTTLPPPTTTPTSPHTPSGQ